MLLSNTLLKATTIPHDALPGARVLAGVQKLPPAAIAPTALLLSASHLALGGWLKVVNVGHAVGGGDTDAGCLPRGGVLSARS